MDETQLPARPQRADAQASREALLEAARALVADRGPEALTVVAVARRAGLNRSTAYQHFRSRDELVSAVSAAFTDELRERVRIPRDFGAQVDFFVDLFEEKPEIARAWVFRLLQDGSTPGLGWGDSVEAMRRLAASPKSQDGIDAEMLAVISLSAALVWPLLARQRSASDTVRKADTRRFARELKRLFLYGALRPEHWPWLAAELAEAPAEDSAPSAHTPKKENPE